MDRNDSIEGVMTRRVHTVTEDAPVLEAAVAMRDDDIGDVVVVKPDGAVCGILTDRDIVVRLVAEGRAPGEVRCGDICTHETIQIAPSGTVGEAISLMQENAVRRVPVVDAGRPLGVVSLGDLAQVRDPDSALGKISAATPTH